MTRLLIYNRIVNILLITDLYPVSETEKTTPKTMQNFVKEWEKQGHRVDVIKPNFILNSFLRGKPFYKTGKYGNVYNVNYWTPFLGSVKCKMESGKWNNFQLSTFKFQPDTSLPSCPPNFIPSVIIAHMPSGILFADKLGLPFVAGIHNSDLTVLTSPLYAFHFRKRMIRALKNAKAIACRSFVIKKKLLELFPEFEAKTFVAPSGIDEKIIAAVQLRSETAESEEDRKVGRLEGKLINEISLSEIPQEQQSDTVLSPYRPIALSPDTNLSTLQPFNRSTIKIITCAHFKKRKNIDKLIIACKDLDGVELIVIGDGKIRKSLEKLDKNVIFTGRLKPEEVYEKMRESDVFILPSVNETFGMVYLEAMAQGCITVCTKNDGISGIIKDGENGFLTEPNIEGIKSVLLKIKNLPSETIEIIRKNAFETVKDLTSEKVAENYLQQILKIF